MKCKNCGAQMGLDVKKCPYCGTVNEIAIKREENLTNLVKENEEFKEQLLERSKEEMHYRLHKRMNLAMLCLLLVFLIGGSLIVEFQKNHVSKKDEQLAKEYYEAGNFKDLYYHLHEKEMFGFAKYYDYCQMALLWTSYNDCQIFFSRAYDQYCVTGKYSAWDLERCIESGCKILTSYVSFTYGEKMSEQNGKALKPYQEQVRILFAGVLQIPEEMFDNLKEDEYDRMDALKDYVLEVLPNE